MKNKLIKIASKVFDIPEEEIKIDGDFLMDYGADSLSISEFHLEVSEQFKIMEDMPEFETIGDCINWLEERGINE